MIQVDYNDVETNKLINELRQRMSDIGPVMDATRQIYQSGVQQRFIDQVDPDNQPWAQLSPVTLARRRKAGKGAQILRDTGVLMNSIQYKISGNTVTLFTNLIYAGTHQYGAAKGAYRAKPPIPWGNVPQRRFLGPNQDDNKAVAEMMNGYLKVDQTLSWWRRLFSR